MQFDNQNRGFGMSGGIRDFHTTDQEGSKMNSESLTDERMREYEFNDGSGGRVTYRIENPVNLFRGTTTHRIVDKDGIVHCVPAVGIHGCVLRWMPKDKNNPVAF